MSVIKFKEGSFHLVTITVPEAIDLSKYIVSVQVRKYPSASMIFPFSTDKNTLIVSGQNIILNIPAYLSNGKSGRYKWQLSLYTNKVDAILFDIFDFIVEDSVNHQSNQSSATTLPSVIESSQDIVLQLPNVIGDSVIPDLRQFVLVRGDKGDPFLFSDFTPEQILSLKIKGDKGEAVEMQKSETHIQWRVVGDQDWIDLVSLASLKGDQGNAFTFDMFTPEQLLLIRGSAFTYADFTEEQLALLKGQTGDAFTYNMFTTEQLALLKGEKGDPFLYSDFTIGQLAALKGEKGDDFVFSDFTLEQLAVLKGAKGDAFVYADFTLEQLAAMKGAKGDAFVYADFTVEQLASLVGATGKSAYQAAVDGGFVGTQVQWIASLVGATGKSAYQSAVDGGYAGTVSQWLASLIGATGPSGTMTANSGVTITNTAASGVTSPAAGKTIIGTDLSSYPYKKLSTGKTGMFITDDMVQNAERPGLTFDGTTQYLQHHQISVPNGQPWTWLCHLNWSGVNTVQIIRGLLAGNPNIYLSTDTTHNHIDFREAVSGTDRLFLNGSSDLSGIRTVFGISSDGLGNLSLIKFGKIVSTISGVNTAMIFEGLMRSSGSNTYNTVGSLYDDFVFNCTLTATELMDAYIGLMTDRYEVPFKYRGGNQTELVVNGNFATDTVWVKLLGTTISGGAATFNTSLNTDALRQPIGALPGKYYKIVYTILNYNSGSVQINVGGYTNGIIRSANGTYTEYFLTPKVVDVNLFIRAWAGGFIGSISNVSVVEIGCLSEFRGVNMNSISARDTSGNGYHAAAIASPQVIVPQPQVEAIKTAITGDTVLTGFVPINYRREHMRIVNKTANAVVLNLGTTAGGTDILFDVYLAGNDYVDIDLSGMTVSTAFTIYLSSKAWNSSNLSIVVVSKQGVAL